MHNYKLKTQYCNKTLTVFNVQISFIASCIIWGIWINVYGAATRVVARILYLKINVWVCKRLVNRRFEFFFFASGAVGNVSLQVTRREICAAFINWHDSSNKRDNRCFKLKNQNKLKVRILNCCWCQRTCVAIDLYVILISNCMPSQVGGLATAFFEWKSNVFFGPRLVICNYSCTFVQLLTYWHYNICRGKVLIEFVYLRIT